jgi:hypothetical protein
MKRKLPWNGTALAFGVVKMSLTLKKGVFVKKLYWILGSLVLLTSVSATSYAVSWSPAPVPEADPTVLIAIGVTAIGYLAGVTRYRNKK